MLNQQNIYAGEAIQTKCHKTLLSTSTILHRRRAYQAQRAKPCYIQAIRDYPKITFKISIYINLKKNPLHKPLRN